MASEQVSNSTAAPVPPAPVTLPSPTRPGGESRVTGAPVQPLQAWLARLGLSGKLLAIGGLIGVIAVFLPLLSMSVQMPTFGGASPLGGKGGVNLPTVSSSQSFLVIGDLRGVLCLLGYLGALALAFVLYPPSGLGQKALAWAGLGVGGFITLLALWLLLAAFNGAGMIAFGGSFQISVGIGAFLNLLASAVVATGGFLKAREEKLF